MLSGYLVSFDLLAFIDFRSDSAAIAIVGLLQNQVDLPTLSMLQHVPPP
jgi:hypothetical protein